MNGGGGRKVSLILGKVECPSDHFAPITVKTIPARIASGNSPLEGKFGKKQDTGLIFKCPPLVCLDGRKHCLSGHQYHCSEDCKYVSVVQDKERLRKCYKLKDKRDGI